MTCADPSVATMVESRLAPLAAAGPVRADITVDIRGPGSGARWPADPEGPGGRPIYDAPGGSVDYYDLSDQLFVDYEGRVRLLCTPGQGRIELGIVGRDPGDAVLAAHPLLTIALLETMKRFGRFSLHAAALCLDDRGILVPGSSGSGKSTLSVTLTRAGFGFLSDDTVFLTESADGIWVAGFPDEIDVTAHTVSMFPELAHLAAEPLRPGRDKFSFRAEEVFGVRPVEGCRPAAIVVPHVTEGMPPRLDPLAPGEALLELMPNLLATDPAATQAHLDMLAELVRGVPCYSLVYGSDLEAAAARITELVT